MHQLDKIKDLTDNGELYDLSSKLRVIWVIGSRRMTMVRYVAGMGEGRNVYGFGWEA